MLFKSKISYTFSFSASINVSKTTAIVLSRFSRFHSSRIPGASTTNPARFPSSPPQTVLSLSLVVAVLNVRKLMRIQFLQTYLSRRLIFSVIKSTKISAIFPALDGMMPCHPPNNPNGKLSGDLSKLETPREKFQRGKRHLQRQYVRHVSD